MQTFTPAKSPGARFVTEGDILAEAAPHERSDYLLLENVASKLLCTLVEGEVEAESVGGRRRLIDHSGALSQKAGSGEQLKSEHTAQK